MANPKTTYVALARAAAELQTGVAAANWKVVQAVPRTWNDGSLGLPKPGEYYTMALVDGYLIAVQNGDKILRFHCGYNFAKFAGEGLSSLPDFESCEPSGGYELC